MNWIEILLISLPVLGLAAVSLTGLYLRGR